jgi:hypothetical protein
MPTSKNLELSELARKITVNDTSVSLTGVTIPPASLENTGVTAGQYGSSTTIPVITTNAKGQLTAISTASLPANLATETYVNTAISNLVNSAPSTLDTLNELATALGNDASFASTVTTALGTKATTTALNALETSLQTYVNARLPSGFIGMWSGSIATIPTGWLLCNGTNGTPDLRDRFIVGAGSTYAVAATGGTANAVVVSHDHGGSTATEGSHTHTFSGNTGGQSANHTHSMGYYMDDDNGNNGYLGIVDGDNTQSSNYQTGGTSNDHSHSFSGTTSAGSSHSHTISSAGEDGTNKNLPPYYALAYIMKA